MSDLIVGMGQCKFSAWPNISVGMSRDVWQDVWTDILPHISLTWIMPRTSLCSLTRYKKQNVYFIESKVLPNLLDYFSTQVKQSTSISTRLLMVAFTHQMGVKLRKYRILNISQHPGQKSTGTGSSSRP